MNHHFALELINPGSTQWLSLLLNQQGVVYWAPSYGWMVCWLISRICWLIV